MSTFVLVLILSYVLFSIFLITGWSKALESRSTQDSVQRMAGISILIPFRNEAEELPRLIEELFHELSQITFPFELILIDDQSSDDTWTKVERACGDKKELDLVKSDGIGKVAAIRTGLARSSFEGILSLDADVNLPIGWGKAFEVVLSQHGKADLIVLPVIGKAGGHWISRIAALDFMALIGSTFSFQAWKMPIMANAAQLYYRKEHASWPDDLVSGDDTYLLHSIKSKGGRIDFALEKGVVVSTPMPSKMKEFVHQRARWASKASIFKDVQTLLVGWYVLLLNALIWSVLLWTIFGGRSAIYILGLLAIKALMDSIFLYKVSTWFAEKKLLMNFPLAFIVNSIMFPFLYVYQWLFGFNWKGRVYR